MKVKRKKIRNPVAKFMNKFNKSATHKDKKKEAKKNNYNNS